MSREAVLKMVERARADREYLALLITDPAKAAEGYDLTPAESEALAANTAEKLLAIITPLEGEEPVPEPVKVPHDGGCHGAGTCKHTCGSTCDVTFGTHVSDPKFLTFNFTSA